MRGDFDINSTWRSGRVVIVSLRRGFIILTQKRFSLFRFFKYSRSILHDKAGNLPQESLNMSYPSLCSGKKYLFFLFQKTHTKKETIFFYTQPPIVFTAESSFLPCFRYVHERRGGIAISTTIVSALMRERYPVCSS